VLSMMYSTIKLPLAVLILSGTGCATLTVPPVQPADLQGVPELAFLGAYDARALQGGVETQKAVTTYQSSPNYVGGRYAGSNTYAQTTMELTGEISPGDAVGHIARGFLQSSNANNVRDMSGSSALETRSEMGMDWLAKNDASLPRYIASIEVRDAEVGGLDGVRGNASLGWTSIFMGFLCFPCWFYPLIAETNATGHIEATLRIYDKTVSRVVAREPINVDMPLKAKGFHTAEDVFRMLSTRVGEEAGVIAAQKVAAFAKGGTPPPLAPETPSAARAAPAAPPAAIVPQY
jgi:hypothetical protein